MRISEIFVMLLNYVSDNRGVPIAVQIPIEDWGA
jgi:hypothetical protein